MLTFIPNYIWIIISIIAIFELVRIIYSNKNILSKNNFIYLIFLIVFILIFSENLLNIIGNHELIQNIIEFVQLLICVILIFYFCIITPKSSKYKYQEKIGKFLFFVGLIMLFLMYFFKALSQQMVDFDEK